MAQDDQATIDSLVEALDDVDFQVREMARHDLANFGQKAVPALIKGLQSDTQRRCWESAKVLMEIEDLRWFEPMVEALKSPHIMLGSIALEAIKPKVSTMPHRLLDALPKAHQTLQPHLIRYLVELNVRKSIPVIITLLEETDVSTIKQISIEALIEFEANEALDLIVSFADDDSAHVRKRVARAIEVLGRPESSKD